VRFVKLRLLGFKSFVEPVEFLIEDGLTGVVGPNGCGKSNLVEALRWVMGENSYKNMRASGMDDVIFSGSGNRPARNTAEVTLFLDNADRTAPAAFNDADELQVSRRIERESGSVYRINGKEVRARDVQLLFADASTGARSPSMVGQGRIGELISAKPQARRALLEEAAGISGLYTRRHEAELRLRAAEQNLERLEDVVAELDGQVENLKRQARQANRYRALSADIRRTEAMSMHLKWAASKSAETQAQQDLSRASAAVGERAELQARSAAAQAGKASELPGLREKEAIAAAILQRLELAMGEIDAEARRIAGRENELRQRQTQMQADLDREKTLSGENAASLARLETEDAELRRLQAEQVDAAPRAREKLAEAASRLAASEEKLEALASALAAEQTRKTALERAVREAQERARRLDEQWARIEKEMAEIARASAGMGGGEEERGRVDLLEKRVSDAETDAASADARAQAAREREQEMRAPLAQAREKLAAIETEAKTLARMLQHDGGLFPAIVEKVRANAGYETALGAALGEDLDAPADPSAAAHWLLVAGDGADPALPQGAEPLSGFVRAPAELARRLAQTGVVSAEDGPRLQKLLKPGQRLVTLKGDLWRWDGFVSGAEAPSAAAQRLAQKNRLEALDAERVTAAAEQEARQGEFDAAAQANRAAAEEERASREAWRVAQRELAAAREQLAAAERAMAQFVNRRAALEEAGNRVSADIQDNRATLAQAESALQELPPLAQSQAALEMHRNALAAERAETARLRAEAESLDREAQARLRRIEAIAAEHKAWKDREARAGEQIRTLEERLAQVAADLAGIASAPAEIEKKRAAAAAEIDKARQARSAAADALAAAEADLAALDRAARAAEAELSQSREARARAEERLNSAQERRFETENRIREELGCHPAEALALSEHAADAPLPDAGAVERSLERLKADRERLGPVNLRADAEQEEIASRRNALVAEREDLIAAIKRLRQGIQSLNREGRERLLEAFDKVNEQFQRLFTHLFGGGTAELQLVEAEDPLEAGLEILARPPGKRPQTMTLLSGGEQALTAMALIFAVFLTNPAPICVLDEVDAPLDDHNVERFCNLMDEMVKATQTRFVIITHNPITMARMSRLFGVTMVERGVSQLVSVNLEEAERLREAG
jgi:chromosome segregation protein